MGRGNGRKRNNQRGAYSRTKSHTALLLLLSLLLFLSLSFSFYFFCYYHYYCHHYYLLQSMHNIELQPQIRKWVLPLILIFFFWLLALFTSPFIHFWYPSTILHSNVRYNTLIYSTLPWLLSSPFLILYSILLLLYSTLLNFSLLSFSFFLPF